MKETDILDTSPTAEREAPAQFALLKRAAIVPSKTNPRTQFDAEYLKELGGSIKDHGIVQPLLVRPLPASRLQDTAEDRVKGQPLPTHEIICGECRWRASAPELGGLDDIPVMIRALDDLQVLQIQLVENLKRRDLHPLEEAEGYERLVKDHNMQVEDIAGKVKKSASYVYKSLKLLELTPECRKELYAGKLTFSTALLVARAPGYLQAQIAKDIMQPDFHGEPMSFRAAQKLIHDRYMLQLGSAIFNIKDESLVAKAGSCTACPKRTGANTDLFEDVKSADTCTDPKCFDAKKVAHYEQVAKAAEARGQKVIQGKEAKELMPHEYSTPKGYKLLDDKDYINGRNQSLRQAIGKQDLPTPVVIVNPHTKVAQEALPVAVADKLLRKASEKKSAAKAPSEMELQRRYDEAWQDRSLRALFAAMMAGKVVMNVAIARQIAIQIQGVSSGSSDTTRELLDLGKVGDGMREYLAKCDDNMVPVALLMLLLDDEFDSTYHSGAEFPLLKLLAKDAGVDVTSIQEAVKQEMKEEAAARAVEAAEDTTPEPAKQKKQKAVTPKGTVGKKGTATFMAPLQPDTVLAAIVGQGPMPRTEIVAKLWEYIKANKLQSTTNKRMVECDTKLQALFGKEQVSMFEMAGALGKHSTDANGSKKLSTKDATAEISKAMQAASGTGDGDTVESVSWPFPVDASKTQPGARVKIKDGLKGRGRSHVRKCAGKEGALVSKTPAGWLIKIDGTATQVVVDPQDLVVISAAEGKAPDAPKLSPQAAWPFPTKKKPSEVVA